MSLHLDSARAYPSRPVIGKDVLELLSTAMYVDPLTIYREYVQNAADAIDDAYRLGIMTEGGGGIAIVIDPLSRSISIRDNGIGIPADRFRTTLTAIGASSKRGTSARGFRGVGRLSGLAYARELTFRSSAPGENTTSVITWDCRALRAVLRDFDDPRGLAEIVGAITTVVFEEGTLPDDHFFEVTLKGVPRIGDDRLLSTAAVSDYLTQVAPVPFASEFSLGVEIDARLATHAHLNRLRITVNDAHPLTRPLIDQIPVQGGRPLCLRAAKILEIPSIDGEVAAVAWVAHHDYEGAINAATRVRGLRARVGDVQVGDSSVFDDIFPETRFNAWTVGEVHILDARIVPNGRRDDFERNVHLANLKNHLAPLGREIATKCRTYSHQRKRLRDFEIAHASAIENIEILKQGSVTPNVREQLALSVDLTLMKMEKLATPRGQEANAHERAIIETVRAQLNEVEAVSGEASPLERMQPERRAHYEEMFALIYECAANRTAAKALIDRILLRLA